MHLVLRLGVMRQRIVLVGEEGTHSCYLDAMSMQSPSELCSVILERITAMQMRDHE